MRCENCGQSERYIYDREWWWCPDCATIIDGRVQFPSGGKFVPETIMTEIAGGVERSHPKNR